MQRRSQAQRLLSAARRRPIAAAAVGLAAAAATVWAIATAVGLRRAPEPASRLPCFRVNLADTDTDAQRQCVRYLELPLVKPSCPPGAPRRVPRVYHAIAGEADPPHAVRANLLLSPGYKLNYHNDSSAYGYVLARCGKEVAEAFRCFLAPAYRADVFRYCAVLVDGGVYVDADLVLLAPLDDIVSPCSHATVGHDYPQGPTVATRAQGLQMKILAAAPGSALAACALASVVANVKSGRVPGPADGLVLTGPKLLADCYNECVAAGKCTREGTQPATDHPWDTRTGRLRRGAARGGSSSQRPARVVSEPATATSVAITYRDARHAAWPYTGMLGVDASGRDAVLAYEAPKPVDFGYHTESHYSKLTERGAIYHEDCMHHL